MGCPCYAFHYIMDDASLERANLLRRIARDRGGRVEYHEYDEYLVIVAKIPHCRLREVCDELKREGVELHGIDVSTSEQLGIVETRGQRGFVTAWPKHPVWVGQKYPAGEPPKFAERRRSTR